MIFLLNLGSNGGCYKKVKLRNSIHAPIRLCNQFKAYNVFFLLREENIQEVTPAVTKNVFSILTNNDRVLPDKLSIPKNNFDILFNFIIDYFKEINISWPKTLKFSTAHFAKTLQSMLWHITCDHEYFTERSTIIPARFGKFKNLNKYAAQKHSKPLLRSSELKKFTEKICLLNTALVFEIIIH